MNRRACLATAGTLSASVLSGCLGDSTDRRADLVIERARNEDTCLERELVDFERVTLVPRLMGLLGLPSSVEWELDLKAGEELYLRITNPDIDFLPLLRVLDPDGTPLVDERPVDNIYIVHPPVDGRYVVDVRNPRWAERGEWFVDIDWYSSPGCRR